MIKQRMRRMPLDLDDLILSLYIRSNPLLQVAVVAKQVSPNWLMRFLRGIFTVLSARATVECS